MTADAIRAAATGGVAVSGQYRQGNTSPVTVYRKGEVLYWTSGMSIDCDGQPGSACNINTDPYFQPNTAFNQSNGQPLKAEELPFVVVPLASSIWDYRDSGIRGGDLVVMAYRDRYVFGVVGDLGPSARIGEGSYAAAQALGINPNPRSGGVGSGVTYVVFRGVKVSPIESKAEAARLGAQKLAEWLGEEPPVTTPAMSAIDKMVAAAEADLGLGEPNYIQDWYDREFGDLGSNWAWCNGAVTWWAHKSGNAKAVCFSDRGHYAYTVYHAQAFKDRGQWTFGTAGIRRGDIVFFDWNGVDSISAIDHVGLVVDVKADGVHTIEGNIEDACRRKVRQAREIAGYGRPAYVDAAPADPPPAQGPIGGTVKLSDAQAHTDAATRVIQTALNREFGGVVVDGDYGPQTTAAYTRWQQSLGWPGDGQPGEDSLTKLGAKYGFAVLLDNIPSPPEPPTPVTYTVVAGDTLSSIAADKGVAGGWEALYEANKAIIGDDPNAISPGLVLVLPDADPEPEPPAPEPEPEPEPEPPAPTKPLAGQSATFEVVFYGAPVSESVRVVQRALNLEFGGVAVDGDYGPQTRAAYKRWQESLGYTGDAADGAPGITSFTALADEYGFTVKRGTVPPSTNDGEPAHNYTRTTWSGRTINQRTRAMLSNAVALNGGSSFTVTQGSYNAGGVAASAGTHDGGGVVDIAAANLSGTARTNLVTALRKAGFAAWLRTPAEGFSYHIHACAIGDREMSPSAKRQVQSYFNGRNALASNRADTHPGGRPYPAWAGKYDE